MYDSNRYCAFYHNNLCHVCKQPQELLKRCSNCKCLAYCSKEHQKADWKIHKKLCQVISLTEKDFSNFSVKNYDDFQTLRYMRCAAWQNKLNRPLENFENQIWMFPKVCIVCYSKDVLIDCRKCWNVSYCSQDHQSMFVNIHRKYCDALKLNTEIDVYNMKEGNKPLNVRICDIPLQLKSLPRSLSELMHYFDSSTVPRSHSENIQRIIKCDYISPAANILYGLEQSKLVVNRTFNSQNLVIHIVGADVVEVSWQWIAILELIFHWISNLKTLHFIVIGPEIGGNWTMENVERDFCDSCKKRNVTARCTFSSNLYHNINSEIESPDIIAVFNSGIHAYSDNIWTDSLDLLTLTGVPLILTAYTQIEISSDVDVVIKHSHQKICILVEPQRNPFSCMKPLRDFNTFNVPIFYVNGYIAILLKKVENTEL